MLKCSVCGFENKEIETCIKCGSAIHHYVKAIPLCDVDDVLMIKKELDAGNILIVNIVPFLEKECGWKRGFSKMTQIANELAEYAVSIGGDLARIGDERLILAPSSIRIWGSKLRSAVDNSE
jgi:SepF-like predicted cell division protein (DUF552 family)